MATLDDSPSLFSGKPWTSWSDKVEGKKKTEIKAEESGSKAKDDSDSMKLRIADMPLYGHCPARDDFYLVVCECCGQVIKPQALRRHIEQRHGSHASTKSSGTVSSKSSGHSHASGSHTKHGHSHSSTKERFGSSSTRHQRNKVPNSSSSSRQADNSLNNSLPVVELERMPSPLIKKNMDKTNKTASPPASSISSPQRKTETSTATTTTTVTLLSMPSTLSPLLSSPTIVAVTTTTTTSSHNSGVKSIARISSSSRDKSSPAGHIPSSCTAKVSNAATLDSTGSSIAPPSSSKHSLTNSAMTTTLPSVTSTGTKTTSSSVGHGNTTSTVSSRKILPTLANFPKPEKLLPCKDREYDPNKHCGVWVADTGKQCTRSLTCKTHALSLRRKVEGRRKRFDDLLKEHKELKEAMLRAKAEAKAVEAAAKKGKQLSLSSNTQLTSPTLSQSITTTAVTTIQSPPLGSALTSVFHSPLDQAAKQAVAHTFPKKLLHSNTPRPVPLPVVPCSESTPPPETCSHLSSDGEEEVEESRDLCGYPHLAYHPRPAAMNSFGSRLTGGGCFVFSRKTDLLHAAFKAAVEHHLHPPPHKKLCIESRLPQGSHIATNMKDPYEFNVGDRDNGLSCTSSRMSGKVNNPKSSATSPSISRTIKPKEMGLRSPTGMVLPLAVTSPSSNSGVITPNKSCPGVPGGTGSMGGNLKRKRSGSSPSAAGPNTSFGNQTSVSSPISIAIPTASLNLSLGNPAGLGSLSTHPAQHHLSSGTNKSSSFLKDFNIVVTSMEHGGVVNGQLVNLPGASLGDVQHIQLNHLAETAKSCKASTKQRTALKSHNSAGNGAPDSLSAGQLTTCTSTVVSTGHVNTPQPSPSNTPSPLFQASSTSPLSATSPLANGILSPPGTGLPVNHHLSAASGGRLAGIGALTAQHMTGSLGVNEQLSQHHNSGTNSRVKGGSRSSNHKQLGHMGVGKGTSAVGTQPVTFTTLGKNRVVMSGAQPVYGRQVLSTNKYSHIQIQPNPGGGKTITSGKLAINPVSLTIPIVTTHGMATALAPPTQARALLLSTTEDHHQRDLAQNSASNLLS